MVGISLGSDGVDSRRRGIGPGNAKEIQQICQGVDMVSITADMGGGTGIRVGLVVAEIARDEGCLTWGW